MVGSSLVSEAKAALNRFVLFRSMLSRILAALLGGYLFTNVMSLLLFFLLVDNDLITEQTDEVNIAAIHSVFNSMAAIGLSSFVIYTIAALWVFHTRSASRAWAGMLLPSIVGIGIIYWLLPPAIHELLRG